MFGFFKLKSIVVLSMIQQSILEILTELFLSLFHWKRTQQHKQYKISVIVIPPYKPRNTFIQPCNQTNLWKLILTECSVNFNHSKTMLGFVLNFYLKKMCKFTISENPPIKREKPARFFFEVDCKKENQQLKKLNCY